MGRPDRKDSRERLELTNRLHMVMAGRPGRSRAISEAALYEAVYQKPYPGHDQARPLRGIIEDLRHKGMSICSFQGAGGNGYYLASSDSELEDFCIAIRKRALKILSKEARLRQIAMPQLLGQIQMKLEFERQEPQL